MVTFSSRLHLSKALALAHTLTLRLIPHPTLHLFMTSRFMTMTQFSYIREVVLQECTEDT
jgi:hypothetical protein